MLALTNDDLFVTVASKGTETDSVCHQRIGPLHETVSLLKDELRDNQVTVNNLIVVMKNFTANENKCTRNKEQKANVCRKGKDDVVSELLEIDNFMSNHKVHLRQVLFLLMLTRPLLNKIG